MGGVVLTFAQFEVEGTTDTYFVNYDDESGWYCTCPDHYFRKRECKHILEAKMSVRCLLRESNVNKETMEVDMDG